MNTRGSLSRRSGGEGARRAPLLAFVSLSLLPVFGCRKETAPLLPRTVRYDVLRPLHPVWEQVALRDRAAQRIASEPPPERPPVFTAPFPRPVRIGEAAPENLSKERLRRLREAAEKYLRQLRDFLTTRNRDQLLRDTRGFRQAEEARLVQRLAADREREAKERGELERGRNAVLPQIQALEIKAVALQTQIDAYTGLSRRDAEVQKEQVEQQIKTLRAERDRLLREFEARSEAARRARREARDAAIRNYKTRREEELRDALEKSVETERSRLEAETITPLGEAMPVQPALPPIPLLPPPDGVRPLAEGEQAHTIALGRQQQDWAAERRKLVQAIEDDLRKAVEQAAHREGWKIVSPGTPGAVDATDALAKILREQWQPPVAVK